MLANVPFSGWVLEASLALDNKCPGFCGHILRASHERRHVISAYLSMAKPARPFDCDRARGVFLMTAGHDEIIAAAFRDPSPRMRSALSRGGSQPYNRRYYPYLHALLTSKHRPATLRAIRSLERVNPTRLRIARALPSNLQHASLIEVLQSADQARDLAKLVQMIVTAGADEKAVTGALRLLRKGEDIRRFARRWSLRVRFPDHPVPPREGYLPIQDGISLDQMARSFANCSRSYTANLLEGRSAFAVVTVDDDSAVVHLVQHSGKWFLEDIYGPRNDDPAAAVVSWATEYLAAAGVSRRHVYRATGEWACLRRLAGQFAFQDL